MAVRAVFFDFFGVIYVDGALNKSLLTCIRRLHARCRIGIITSTGDLHRYVERSIIDTYFDMIIASSEVGLFKPDPEIFKYACARFDISPREALLVDDTPENCDGARSVGMGAYLYTDIKSVEQFLMTVTQ